MDMAHHADIASAFPPGFVLVKLLRAGHSMRTAVSSPSKTTDHFTLVLPLVQVQNEAITHALRRVGSTLQGEKLLL